MPGSAQATFCATLVDEWGRAGVRHAVIAPGSRSTPLALALAADGRIAVHAFHDERPAAFCGLGIGLVTGVPAVVLCSSGTAATHFHAAVVEAHQARVPLLVCTADRPPELRDVGAPQTIDQSHLYGGAVRWFCDPGVADEAVRGTWRSLAARAFGAAQDGPVHLNLPFREPLVGEPDELPASRPGGAPWHRWGSGAAKATAAVPDLAGRRGVFVAGGASDRSLLDAWASALQWPVLSDPRAGVSDPYLWDPLLRVPRFTEAHRPDVVVRLGSMPASKVLAQWLAATGAEHIVVDPRASDPDRLAHLVIPGMGEPVDDVSPADPSWLASWRSAGAAAERAVAAALAGHAELTEPFIVREVVASLDDGGGDLVVASSMPIRDVEWFARPSGRGAIYANRGANGIDGTIATAIGVALASPETPTTVLLGDVAFLHDSTALVAIRRRNIDLTIVVIDNDGGGIFSFLPQAAELPNERFEQLFGTPHGVKPEELAAAHGLASLVVEDPTALGPALASTRAAGGVWLVVARTDRDANVKVHDELHRAIAAALS